MSLVTWLPKSTINRVWCLLFFITDYYSLKNNIARYSKTILWNGPLGFFEREEFSKGTLHLAKVISESDAYSVIGGGETLTAFNQSNLLDKVGYASTAGGAFLEYIEKGSLPSLDALKEKIWILKV